MSELHLTCALALASLYVLTHLADMLLHHFRMRPQPPDAIDRMVEKIAPLLEGALNEMKAAQAAVISSLPPSPFPQRPPPGGTGLT